jgi:hypothetical protein
MKYIYLVLFISCGSRHFLNSKVINLQLIEDSNTSSSIRKNQTLIKEALFSLGLLGGGKIILPKGVFYIGPIPEESNEAVKIEYDNIEIIGQGVDNTILKTNGDYKIINGVVKRGDGIVISPKSWTPNCKEKRKNIKLRHFQLDGQSGYTGNHNWPADPATGDGWDITHKGIIVNQDGCADGIYLRDLYVHSYKGEVLYSGGLSTGKVEVKRVKSGNTNASCFNIYASDLLVNKCDFFGSCMMWMELLARKSIGSSNKNETIISNCKFNGQNTAASGIVLAQGDGMKYKFIIKENKIYASNGAIGFFGGIGGEIIVENNEITSGDKTFYFAKVDGYVNDEGNNNILIKNNKVESSGTFIQIYGESKNVNIVGNKMIGTSPHATSVMYGGCKLNDFYIKDNTFISCRLPEENLKISGGLRPIFSNNNFESSRIRDNHSLIKVTNSNQIIKPISEQMFLYFPKGKMNFTLANDSYKDGQKLKVFILSNEDKIDDINSKELNKNEVISFKYSVNLNKWVKENN